MESEREMFGDVHKIGLLKNKHPTFCIFRMIQNIEERLKTDSHTVKGQKLGRTAQNI
jgi:hypothetical protein